MSIYIINGCCRVENKYNNLLMECASLHMKITNEEVRKDFESLEIYYRNSRPVFSAAGFFHLNQELFSTFCSAIVSYLIIIIQLRSVDVGM